LLSQFLISIERNFGSQGKNCIGRSDGALINLQVFDVVL